MTHPVFLYGTLRDPGQLSAVLGHAEWEVSPARLPQHAVHRDAALGAFPVLVAADGDIVTGALLHASLTDLERLDWYEAAFGYDRHEATLEDGRTASVYQRLDVETVPENWDLDDWVASWGAMVELAATDAMTLYPETPPGDMGARFRLILSRAASRLRARAAPNTGGVRLGAGRKGVDLKKTVRRHHGFFALDELHLEHRRFDGGLERVVREVFVSTDASLVLPYDPVRDEVVLVEQFRAGAFRRGDPHPWSLEPVAGLIDPGETPEDCARREAVEEAGLSLDDLVRVPGGYPSPGATAEYYHLFVGLTDLSAYRPGTGGKPEEGEDILTHLLKLDAALALTETGEAAVLPLAYLLHWTGTNRARLGAAARH